MSKRITTSLKEFFSVQNTSASGNTISEVLKDGFSKLNSADVSGNSISTLIKQCADTGTFSGGSAPTVVNEIIWDGDTTGLDSVSITLNGTTHLMYKVSDEVLPFAYNRNPRYTYTMITNRDEEFNVGSGSFTNAYIVLDPEGLAVISALWNNYTDDSYFGEFTIPTSGTWITKDGDMYIKQVIAVG